jgi:hypothetical protein
MEESQTVELIATAVIVGTVLLSGLPSGTAAPGQYQATELGDGNASISETAVALNELQLDRGRFDTAVYYLRVPDAHVTVRDVTDSPRLVYRIQAPKVGIDKAHTRVLGDRIQRTVRLRGEATAIPPAQLPNGTVSTQVTVRVQSFERDRTVYNKTIAVETGK